MISKLISNRSLEKRVGEIEKILREKEALKDHPDVLYFESDLKLGIEQARQIKEHFFLKPYKLQGKIVVLEDASKLTIEAQNALLKILEEPPENAFLILGAASEFDLLPTVVSRCELIIQTDLAGREPETYEVFLKDIEKLQASPVAERFEYIEKLKEKEEFLNAMVHYFHQALRQRQHSAGDLKFLKELILAEEWAAQNVNIRAILEYLMLVMPH